VLCAALLVGACDGEQGGPSVPGPAVSAAASATAPSPWSGAAAGQACATGQERAKPVPAEARALVRAFVAAVDRGATAAARQALDPAFADQVLAGLASTRRLTLLAVSDDY
jgi:hypothetical protein